MREESGFAFGYAVTMNDLSRCLNHYLVGRPGLELGERLRLVVIAETVAVGGGRLTTTRVRRDAVRDCAVTFKAKPERASNAAKS